MYAHKHSLYRGQYAVKRGKLPWLLSRCILSTVTWDRLIARSAPVDQPGVKCHAQGHSGDRASP